LKNFVIDVEKSLLNVKLSKGDKGDIFNAVKNAIVCGKTRFKGLLHENGQRKCDRYIGQSGVRSSDRKIDN